MSDGDTGRRVELQRLRDELRLERAERVRDRERALRRRIRFERLLDSATRNGARRDRALQKAQAELEKAKAKLNRRPVVLALELSARLRGLKTPLRRVRAAVHRLQSGRQRPSVTRKPAVATRHAAVPGAAADTTGASSGAAKTIAIHIVPTTWDAASRWGDTAFAHDLQVAFGRQGWTASVHVRDELQSPVAKGAAVALYLFGLGVPAPRAGQLSLLWIISHPDRVTASTVDQFASVFVASDSFRDELAGRSRPPVQVLHQASNPERFYPDPSGPRHELLFVGNSRGVRRPLVDALASTPHDLAVYGSWRPDLIDMQLVRGSWIPNEELHRYYTGADIVLSDHWEDMRDEGFVANRVFDALASGAFVISDHVTGIDRLLDDAVVTYDDAAELPGLIDRYLADPAARRDHARRGRQAVLERHTFDQRAAAIIAEIERLREHGGDSGDASDTGQE